MVVATRVMYLISGILVLVSSVCIELRFAAQLTEVQRLLVGIVGFIYFAFQFGRFVRWECTAGGVTTSYGECRKLGLDIAKQ
jgi:hypothetical protein